MKSTTTQQAFWSDTGQTLDDGETSRSLLPTPSASMMTPQDMEQAKTAGNSDQRKQYSQSILSISSVADSPASHFQWRDNAEEWLTNAGCGPLFAGLSNSSDQPLWLSKTSQGCCQLMMDGSSEEYSETWPASGSMRNGKCYRQPPLVRRISERESSLLPTPQNHDSRSQGLKREVKDGRIQAANGGESQSLNLGTLAATGLIPTPQAQDYKSGTGYDHGNKKQTPQMRHLSGGL